MHGGRNSISCQSGWNRVVSYRRALMQRPSIPEEDQQRTSQA